MTDQPDHAWMAGGQPFCYLHMDKACTVSNCPNLAAVTYYADLKETK